MRVPLRSCRRVAGSEAECPWRRRPCPPESGSSWFEDSAPPLQGPHKMTRSTASYHRGDDNPQILLYRSAVTQSMWEEDSVRALETLGLTGKEADAYLHLLQHGASTAQQVSQLLGVQYPAVYRVLQSLQSKGWIDVSQERPNRYRARAPRIVSEEARQSRHDDLLAAAEVVGSLKETPPPKNRGADADLWIYKGPESIGRKLREVILSSDNQILCVSPFPVAPEILRLLFDALGRSRRLVRVVLSESNRADLAEFGSLLSRNVRVQFRFPARPL